RFNNNNNNRIHSIPFFNPNGQRFNNNNQKKKWTPRKTYNNNRQSNNRQQADLSQITCFTCNQKGHYANKCPKKQIRSAAQTVKTRHTFKGRPSMRSAATDIRTKGIDQDNILDKKSEHMVIEVKVNNIPARALVDQQTTGASLISTTYASMHNLPTIPLHDDVQVNLALQGSRGRSTHYVTVNLDIGGYTEQVTFLVAALADWDIILGEPLLRTLNANIDVSQRKVTIKPMTSTTPITIEDTIHRRRRNNAITTYQVSLSTTDTTNKHEPNQLMVKLLSKHARLPTKESNDAAGYDLYCSDDQVIPEHSRQLVDTNIAIAIPHTTNGSPLYARIAPRSGLSLKGLDIGAGVIDSDYRGPIKVLVINNSDQPYEIKQGQRFAQLILECIDNPTCIQVNELPTTERGTKGFGSTDNPKQPAISTARITMTTNNDIDYENEFTQFINDMDKLPNDVNNDIITDHANHTQEPTQAKPYSYDEAVKVLGYDPIKEFPDVFPDEKPTKLPPLREINHKIDITEPEQYRSMRPRRIKPSAAFLQQLKDKLDLELQTGRVYPAQDFSACSLFMIKKHDKPNEARFLHDLVERNKITRKDKTPIPDIPTIINTVARHPYRSKIDLTDGYHNVRIEPDSEKFTSFYTPF